MKEEHICCICGKPFIGYGNNPYPLAVDEGARCCDECNAMVIAARLHGVNPKDTEIIKALIEELCGKDCLGYKNIIAKERREN